MKFGDAVLRVPLFGNFIKFIILIIFIRSFIKALEKAEETRKATERSKHYRG